MRFQARCPSEKAVARDRDHRRLKNSRMAAIRCSAMVWPDRIESPAADGEKAVDAVEQTWHTPFSPDAAEGPQFRNKDVDQTFRGWSPGFRTNNE
jgi:hypothetical protein